MIETDQPALRMLAWLPAALLLVVLGVLLKHYGSLPETVPTHFNVRGVADGYGPKVMMLLLPGFGLLLEAFLAWATGRPELANFPVKVTDENRERLYELYHRMMLFTRLCTAALFSTIAVGTLSAVTTGAKGLDPVILLFWVIALLGGSIGWIIAMVRAK